VDTSKSGPYPELPAKREKAGVGLQIYSNDVSILVCDGRLGSVSSMRTNADRKPRARTDQFSGCMGLATELADRLKIRL
jgi:hypothetical protein